MSEYQSANLPLLLQGFPLQTVTTPATIENSQQFTTEVNRGIVIALDYVALNLAIILGQDETFWNDARISVRAGGQDLLLDYPAEYFDYNIDLGNQAEQRIHVNINEGQVLESKLQISATSLAITRNIQVQLHAYYMTEKLQDFRNNFKWGKYNALKRRSYYGEQTALPNQVVVIENTLPKNQGAIIGFSILYLSASIYEATVNLSIDGLNIIKNVNGVRFSRFWQRDPEVFIINLNPGSKFNLTVTNPNASGNPGVIYINFYFDN